MKSLWCSLLILSSSPAFGAEKYAPEIEKLSEEDVGKWVGKVTPDARIDKSIIRRGLISSQTALRADCARYLASNGDLSDLPYLIDALSDESAHVGADYPYAGMATTRYWAHVALVAITKRDYGYRWDDPVKKRQEAILLWGTHWEGVKHTVARD